jgi:PPOX class probable F420-dependent enzyme
MTSTTQAFTGKYLSMTTFRPDGSGVATPVWFVRAHGRLLVETGVDSYKVRRIRRDPAVTIAGCTATGRLRGNTVPGRAELLPDAETERVHRLIARKYRTDLILIRPIRAIQALLRRGRPAPKPVIVAITPTDTHPARRPGRPGS